MKTLIFGGAFDPPHSEHIALVKAGVKEIGAKRLVLVPTFMPPHKRAGFLSYDARAALAGEAFKDAADEVIVDDIEYADNQANYMSDNLPRLKAKYGDVVYLIGGDSLERFSTWHCPEIIASTCPIAVADREGYAPVKETVEKLQKTIGGEYIQLDFAGKDVSSSVLRAKLLLGLETPELTENVRALIEKMHLFENYRGVVAQLRGYQSDELFDHSMNVVLKSVDVNSKHNLKEDFDEVFLAALLHDNAKERKSIDGLNVPESALNSPVLHQYLGAEKARRDFGITDEKILDGIRYHTSAKSNMTTFEKLIYTADSVSDDRDYAPIPALRAIVEQDFEKGFLAVLKRTYFFVKERGRDMFALTEEAYQYYKDEMEALDVPLIMK